MGGFQAKAISNHPLRVCNWFFTNDDGGLIDIGCTWGERDECTVPVEARLDAMAEQVEHCDQVSTSLVGRQLIDLERIGIRATR
jgi:hypothetical protein